MTRRRLVVAWALVAAWAVFIFLMSANTGDDLDSGEGLVSQVRVALMALVAPWVGEEADVISPLAHFCEYLVLGALLQHALGLGAPPRRAVLLAVVIASAYGVTDELHQLLVPGRACDPLDWLVDTAGAALGAGLACAALSRARERVRG